MKRILLATDRTEAARNAMHRAVRLAAQSGARLRIVHSVPESATGYDVAAIRAAITEQARKYHPSPRASALDLSVTIPGGSPADAILNEARLFEPDLIVLGAHPHFGLREAIFGTTATKVVRDCRHKVLIVQTDARRTYRTLLAAIDEDMEDRVLDLALSIASARDLFVVHAFGSGRPMPFGHGGLSQAVRADQEKVVEAAVGRLLERTPAVTVPHLHNVVEEGEVTGVIMRAWSDVRPDLVVIGTHGRHGISLLANGSYAESVILGCPSDILVAPPPNPRP
jgi:universal stress protein E